jgi:TolA-binding protein
MAAFSPVKIDDITNLVKDTVYVSIGLGVIAFQRVQVQRQELRKQLEGQLGDARGSVEKVTKLVDDRVKTVEERLEAVEERFEALAEQLEARLPDQLGDAAKQARLAAKEARSQLRGLVRTNGTSPATS